MMGRLQIIIYHINHIHYKLLVLNLLVVISKKNWCVQSEILLRLHAVISVHLVNLKHNKKFYVIMPNI